MPYIELRFDKDMIVVDGAMGTMLQREGILGDECGMQLNVLDPELISAIHKRYKMAGAQALTTNSFGGTRAKLAAYGLEDQLEELNRAAVRLARQVSPEHVFADIGPCGLVLEPLGDARFEEVFEQYAEQARALVAENPDAVLIETMVDIADARCALLAVRSVTDLPVFVSCTFDATGHMELSGTDPETAAVILEACGADVVGMNCGLGIAQLTPLITRMAAATSLPLLIRPNAGLPVLDESGETIYNGTADDFAGAAAVLRDLGVQFIGSCCGSTPAYTGAIYATVGDLDVKPRESVSDRSRLTLASPVATVSFGKGSGTAIIGERINPTGKPELTSELERGVMSKVLELGESQVQAGAALIDVNVGAPMVDASFALPLAVKALRGVISSPLVFDTTDYRALEKALRVYPGKALINSVNGDRESMDAVFPLAKRYGAAVIALTLDESGIPDGIEGRLAIAKRIRSVAHSYDIGDDDLIFDVLTMAGASDVNAPEVTLTGVRELSARGLNTVLGVSNVSHGLPDRPLLNAAFVRAAIAAGLTAAIANPNDPVISESIRVADATKGEQMERGRMGDDAFYEEALSEWRSVFSDVLDRVSRGAVSQQDVSGSASGVAETTSAENLLKQAVLRGDRQKVADLVDAVIEAGRAPDEIVDALLTPTLQKLGDDFAVGKAFLPQMMLSAGAMKVAVERIKEHLPETDENDFAGKVIFCTVKGDVHSIGKDICVALLESQGFKVFDLGVDVGAEEIITLAETENADVICLSALMTTTLPNMKSIVEQIYEKLPAYLNAPGKAVAVGGAVVTDRWASAINAKYSTDAPGCVRLIQAVIAEKV